MTNPPGLWFRRKRYGWGWTPVTWQGWLSVIIFVGLMVLNAFRLDKNNPDTSDVLTQFIPQTLGLVLIMIMICLRKGEKPRWQWGDKK